MHLKFLLMLEQISLQNLLVRRNFFFTLLTFKIAKFVDSKLRSGNKVCNFHL